MLIAVLLAIATPSPEAEALGRRLADTGALARMATTLTAKETDELVAAHPELAPDDVTTLRAVAAATAAAAAGRMLSAMGHAYATTLDVADLRVLVAAAEAPAAARWRATLPQVMATTMQSTGRIDFKGETLAAFCARTGKACPSKP